MGCIPSPGALSGLKDNTTFLISSSVGDLAKSSRPSQIVTITVREFDFTFRDREDKRFFFASGKESVKVRIGMIYNIILVMDLYVIIKLKRYNVIFLSSNKSRGVKEFCIRVSLI